MLSTEKSSKIIKLKNTYLLNPDAIHQAFVSYCNIALLLTLLCLPQLNVNDYRGRKIFTKKLTCTVCKKSYKYMRKK